MADDEVTLRQYVDAMFTEKDRAVQAALDAQKEAVAAALASADKATAKAEQNAEKWRESANEWRGAMSDRDRELPSRREVEAMNAAFDARLAIVEKAVDHGAGRTEGIRITAGALAGSIASVVALAGLILAAVKL